jgi:hypothetical protein
VVVGSLVAGIDVRRIVAEILLIFVGSGCGEMFSLGGLLIEVFVGEEKINSPPPRPSGAPVKQIDAG